jgi:hypothetical protein
MQTQKKTENDPRYTSIALKREDYERHFKIIKEDNTWS